MHGVHFGVHHDAARAIFGRSASFAILLSSGTSKVARDPLDFPVAIAGRIRSAAAMQFLGLQD